MPGSLLAYGIVALAIMATLAGAVYKIHHSGYEEGVAEVRKELQPKLDACNTAIEAQNRAVSALKAEGDARKAKATQGLEQATKETAGAKAEAARLRKLASDQATKALIATNESERLRGLASTGSAQNAPTACPAASAVEEVRRGLSSDAPPR